MWLIGTSGWQYRDWRGSFYPEKLPQREWLPYFSNNFSAVEVNNTFYRLPKPEAFANWSNLTPDDFTFVVKMSRYLTHIKRLHDPKEPINRFLENAEPLRSKLGAVLFQLPGNFAVDVDLLQGVFKQWPKQIPAVFEFRHDSWFIPEVRRLLEKYNAALCLADRHSRILTPLWDTTDFFYLRLHEGTAKPEPCYGLSALNGWVERLAQTYGKRSKGFIFFNNDLKACAIRNAKEFGSLADKAGIKCSRHET